MQFNNKFRMKDLFMDKELKGLFPQFTKKDGLKNVYSFEWINKKVEDYLKNVFGGRKSGDQIVIKGKFKEKFKQIKGMQALIEDMFNNIPAITKNISKNTKLITPFQCKDQLKEITDPQKKIQVMQIIFDNLNYNPDFQSQGRFRSEFLSSNYLKRQQLWLNAVGYNNNKRIKNG